MRDRPQSSSELGPRDPIEWAIIGVAIGGSSLVLAIKNKIDAIRGEKAAKRTRQAEASNRLRLSAIDHHLGEIEEFLSYAARHGTVVVDQAEKGIAGRAILFSDGKAEEGFNQALDRATAAIGRINRLLSELDLEGFPLKSADISTFVVAPSRRIQRRAAVALRTVNNSRRDRIAAARDVVKDCRVFIRNLEKALGNRAS